MTNPLHPNLANSPYETIDWLFEELAPSTSEPNPLNKDKRRGKGGVFAVAILRARRKATDVKANHPATTAALRRGWKYAEFIRAIDAEGRTFDANPFKVREAFYRPADSETQFSGYWDEVLGQGFLVQSEFVHDPFTGSDGQVIEKWWKMVNIASVVGRKQDLIDLVQALEEYDDAASMACLNMHEADDVEAITAAADGLVVDDEVADLL